MKKLLALLCSLCMLVTMLVGCGGQEAASTESAGSSDTMIALITMDSIDQHWVTLNEGAQKAASELGVVQVQKQLL